MFENPPTITITTIPFLAATAATAIFAFTMVSAAVTDLSSRKIRNSLVAFFLLSYAVLAPLAGFAGSEILWSAAAALAVLVLTFGLFAAGLIGGGDAKLAAATSLWFGLDHTPSYLFWTAVVGGAFALAILLFRKLPLPIGLRNRDWLAQLYSPAIPMPYGVAMAIAALLVFPATRWMATVFAM